MLRFTHEVRRPSATDCYRNLQHIKYIDAIACMCITWWQLVFGFLYYRLSKEFRFLSKHLWTLQQLALPCIRDANCYYVYHFTSYLLIFVPTNIVSLRTVSGPTIYVFTYLQTGCCVNKGGYIAPLLQATPQCMLHDLVIETFENSVAIIRYQQTHMHTPIGIC